MAKHHLQMVVSFLLASGLTACGGGGGSLPGVSSTMPVATNAAQHSASRNAMGVDQAAPTSRIAIDAGGGASGTWLADADYNGGWTATSTLPIDTSKVANPAPQSVYQSQRAGSSLAYAIPNLSPNSAYTVRLHFAETFFQAAGQRVFNATINGAHVLTNFDTFAASGGQNIAIVKQFVSTSDATGKITVSLTSSVNNASIAGIEVISATPTPAPSPTLAPGQPILSIDAGGSAQGAWVADTDYSGGSLGITSSPVDTSHTANAAPAAIYQTQRYAPVLTYAIPNLSPNAAYNVRLHFAEAYFSSAGQRVFSVGINGTTALANFDILQAAGGENIATVKQFATVADATGKITITFKAAINNATVAGIEVISATTGATPAPSPTPTPAPVPSPSPIATPTPSAVGCAGNNGQGGNGTYPVTTCLFTGNTPMHETIAQLKAKGALTLQNAQMIVNYFKYNGAPSQNTERANEFAPVYVATGSDKSYLAMCELYSCPALQGKSPHVPADAHLQDNADLHLYSADVATGSEVDMWECGPNSGYGTNGWTPGGSQLPCLSGGAFPFTSNGLANPTHPGQSGIHAGYAYGLVQVTAGDLLQGHIDHALALSAGCLGLAGDRGRYPADDSNTTDEPCNGRYADNNEAHIPFYGMLVHLKDGYPTSGNGWSLSSYCKTLLAAENTYGAYTSDDGVSVAVQIEPSTLYPNGNFNYSSPTGNPWQDIIYPALAASGDATGASGSGHSFNFAWGNCWNHLSPSNFEAFQIANGS